MNGKIVGAFLVGTAAAAGLGLYYFQVWHFYEDASARTGEIEITRLSDGAVESLPAAGIEAIDAESSPIRFRACFSTPLSPGDMAETYVAYPEAVPLTAPGWFDCFDAAAIGAALEDGRALAFLGKSGIANGVDRVVAVFDDGRGFAWHQLDEETGK